MIPEKHTLMFSPRCCKCTVLETVTCHLRAFFFWHRCLSVSVLGICLQRPHRSLCHSVLCLCQMRVFRMLPLMHTHSFLYGLHKQTKVKCDMLSKIYSIVVVCLDATSCHSLGFWAQKHKLFTKSKNKAALKDPNYLQQRTLLTDLQTCNYLAYQIGVGVYCLFHSFQFCVNYWTKQMFVVCETPHKGWQEWMQINEWKSAARTGCSFISLWSDMWTISAWVTNSSVIFNMLVSLCQKQKYQFF